MSTVISRIQNTIEEARLERAWPFDPTQDIYSGMARDSAVCFICDTAFSEKTADEITMADSTVARKCDGWTFYKNGWHTSNSAYSVDPDTKMLHACADCLLQQLGSFKWQNVHHSNPSSENPLIQNSLIRSFTPCLMRPFWPSAQGIAYGTYFYDFLILYKSFPITEFIE